MARVGARGAVAVGEGPPHPHHPVVTAHRDAAPFERPPSPTSSTKDSTGSRGPGQRRAALRGFIDRIEVGDYPQGVARNGFRKSGEPDAEYAERQRERREVALDQRVNIVWKWAA